MNRLSFTEQVSTCKWSDSSHCWRSGIAAIENCETWDIFVFVLTSGYMSPPAFNTSSGEQIFALREESFYVIANEKKEKEIICWFWAEGALLSFNQHSFPFLLSLLFCGYQKISPLLSLFTSLIQKMYFRRRMSMTEIFIKTRISISMRQ